MIGKIFTIPGLAFCPGFAIIITAGTKAISLLATGVQITGGAC